MRTPAASVCALLVASAAPAEEIRIQVAAGPRLRVEARGGGPALPRGKHVLAARGNDLLVDGTPVEQPLVVQAGRAATPIQPVQIEGRELPGRIEAWARGGSVHAVNALDLEDYVAAVVASEVPANWPDEALRAQAVAARTFAVAQKVAQGPAARAHLGASVLDQVYRGAARPASGAVQAARATAGEVLTWGAAPIAAYFSSSCGGVSESGEAAFHLAPDTTPYLPGAARDETDEPRAWTARIPLREITAALRKADRMRADVRGISVAERTASGRAKTLRIETSGGNKPLAAVELRRILGYNRVRSLLFDVVVDRDAALFRGKGSGHGVGLCQWGARSRATRGETYRDILAHYYPGAEIRRMY